MGMIYSKDYQAIFVHNQKTGGTSIEQYFEQHVPDAKDILPRHCYAVQGIEKLGQAEWRQNYSFGFVRNPWSRLVSWYSMMQEQTERGKKNPLFEYVRSHSTNFEEFLRNCTQDVTETIKGVAYTKSVTRNQLDYFTDAQGKVAVNFIGRFEQLEIDFQQVIKASGVPNFPLAKTNTTSKKDYRTFYTDETRQLVADRFKKDIEYFGYEF
jgi:hypothetical protein